MYQNYCFRLPGAISAQTEYSNMLHKSTGNVYVIAGNTLMFLGADEKFKGVKSPTLASTIKKGIDSKDVYTLNLVLDPDGRQIMVYYDGKSYWCPVMV